MLFSMIVKLTRKAVLISGSAFLVACGGGSPPTGPSGPVSPTPGHPVSGFVFYDENDNGALDADEVVRLPGASVGVGGQTSRSATGGLFTVANVPSGSQPAQVLGAGLPAYFKAGVAVAVDVPQVTGAQVAVPATLEIGNNRPNHFLAFGDSITVGEGGGPGGDYPSYLAADLRAFWGEAVVINAGVSGTRSKQGEPRMGLTVAQSRPAYSLILYGTNDWNDGACRSSFPCYTIDALRSMILQARDGGSNPIIGTIPPANPAYEDRNAAERNIWINDMNELIRQMANEEGVPIAEIHADFMAQPSLEAIFSDHVHPNEEGYVLMSRSWFNAITNPGATNASRSFGFFSLGS
jgi:lysophospholipase L1-like esterase